jgi:BirA family biotin operon repressor/biotin-[acetyl-CoA-carboxylase] ligase
MSHPPGAAGLPGSATCPIFVHDEIDSTNEEARRRGLAGERGPFWIRARRQTAGRGRRGRTWESPEGNLMATLLLQPGVGAAEAAKLSFVAALAVHDVVSTLVAGSDVRVKWPNDVLVGGRKIAGILLESSSEEGGRVPWLAVGIGVNLVHAPQQTMYPATFLAQHCAAPAVDDVMEGLAVAWDARFRVWNESGFEAIRDAWLSVAIGPGQSVEVRLAHETLTGTFETLAVDGALVLVLPGGQRRLITSGEVFFPQN